MLGRTGRRAWISVLVPATVALVAVAVHRTALALAFGVAAVLSLAIGSVAPALWSRSDRALATVGEGVARVLGGVAAAAVHLAVVLPLWALSAATRYHPVASGWSTVESAWLDLEGRRPVRPDGSAAMTGRLGSVELRSAPGVRGRGALRWAVAAASMSLVLLVPSRAGAVRVLDVDTSGFLADGTTVDNVAFNGYPVTRYGHEGEPWAPLHVRELNALSYRMDFFSGVQPRDVRGRTVNVRDGVRVSYTPVDPTLTVWFFGGSTMFGVGQRDDHTIPSVVAHLAERDGIRIRVVNFGVNGDVNWQEVQRFSQALTSAHRTPPDLAVFYDGVNDRALGTARVEMGSTSPDVVDRLTTSSDETGRWSFSVRLDRLPPSKVTRGEEEVRLAAYQYGRGASLARHLGAAYGVPVLLAWQPQPLAGQTLFREPELYSRVHQRLGFSLGNVPTATATYLAVRGRSGAEPVDLTTVLDHVKTPVYFDDAHTNELGASVVAAALYDHIRGDLVDGP